ncbi:S1 RNA-binding domain-containing protein [Bdellovibrio svalbardensis]|uniref:S1 RNA-binding domain-containing protein n=1 Tax=Bdellovibrio svalbardensis TaxID=2972972 RepID=A0ABT6DLS8_9BACT|nr:S1 RNA-binding domain-containing protein [Bdellovibrio svalbardensis]MDG0817838.1 S1 RNA-binding domain-containing protein [Bdellovibrio svalbardensis]
MSKKDIFGDDVNEGKSFEDFEQMFAQSEAQGLKTRLSVGDQVRGEILSIGKEETFVSTGTPVDGMMFTRDLLDENKQVKYHVGEVIDCVVVAIKGGEVRLAKKGSLAASTDSLEDAFDMELPIEGRVSEVVNGGLRVAIQGKTAFCPISQIDSKFVQDATEYVGRKFEFLITQFDKKGRNIVVSRRKLLEMQKAEHEGAFMLKHQPGAVLEGKITRLEKFGAFVELEAGVEGLIHVSELSWSRIHDPKEVVSPGQAVSVKLLKIEEVDGGKLKISLSLKQADGEGSPWTTVPQRFPVGTVVKGTVEKKEVYGLFVNIAPGVTGLLPKSKWRDSVDANTFENKKKGDEITVQIDQIMFEDKKLSLGVPGESDDQSWRASQTSSSGGFASLGDALKGFTIKPK